jgi:serine/threonine protein kinase
VEDQGNLTDTGDVLGTLRYMPPEALDGRYDARGDVYSLGLTLYELLVLRPAFDEAERSKLIKQVTSGGRRGWNGSTGPSRVTW